MTVVIGEVMRTFSEGKNQEAWTIHKFVIQPMTLQAVPLTKGFRVLTVQVQNHIPVMWVLLDVNAEACNECFYVVGTGVDCNLVRDCVYVNTFQQDSLVFHLFQDKCKP